MASSSNTDREKEGQTRTHVLYNPYSSGGQPQDIHRYIYNLPTSPEFLFQEEELRRHRSWGENLAFYTGVAYLTGATLGAAGGSYQGLRSAELGESLKLRTSRILNSSGQMGRTLGNRIGVLGLIYAGLESGITGLTGDDGPLPMVGAGLGTGAIFKAAAGFRSAAVGGVAGAVAVGALVAGKNLAKRYLPSFI